MACATEGMGSTGKDRSTNRRFWKGLSDSSEPILTIFSYRVADPRLIRTIMPLQPAPTVAREYRPTDRKWVTDTNVHHYMTVEGFDASFATAVSSALDMLEVQLEDEASRFLIAEASDSSEPVGCVFFSADDARVGRLRLFYYPLNGSKPPASSRSASANE